MGPANYRARFLSDVTKALILPPISLHWILRYLDVQLPLWKRIPLYIACIVLYNYARNTTQTLLERRRARRVHARPIPRVVGKWPGNIDVIIRMMKQFKTSYPGEVWLRLFQEYQTTTLNLRVLWQDLVGD